MPNEEGKLKSLTNPMDDDDIDNDTEKLVIIPFILESTMKEIPCLKIDKDKNEIHLCIIQDESVEVLQLQLL